MMEGVRVNKGIIKCTHSTICSYCQNAIKTGGGGVTPDTVEGGGLGRLG